MFPQKTPVKLNKLNKLHYHWQNHYTASNIYAHLFWRCQPVLTLLKSNVFMIIYDLNAKT